MSPQFGFGSLFVISLIGLMAMAPMVCGVSSSELLSAVCDSLFNLGYSRL